MTVSATKVEAHSDGAGADELVLDLIERHCRLRPNHPAVVAGSVTLTYGELDRQSDLVAADLAATVAVGPETRVGVCLPRGPEFVIAVVGVVKTGAVVVLIDPANPGTRAAAMVRDAGAVAVISTADAGFGIVNDTAIPVITLDGVAARSAITPRPPFVAARLTPENAAHIAYTSGSTGSPVGVVARHATVARCVRWAREVAGWSGDDRVTWVSSPGYGISLMNEVWPTLGAGATVHIPDRETLLFADRFRDWLLAAGITVVQMTPTLAEPLWSQEWPASTAVRLLLVTGEALRSQPPTTLPFRVALTYGSTETTHIASWLGRGLDSAPDDVGDAVRVDVGRPLRDALVYVLDPEGRPVVDGAIGEIFVGGPGLARGYLGEPAVTAARWLPDQLSPVPGARMVSTGDVGRWLADGSLAVVGRVDRQVKIRGQRINLDEVETFLRRQSGVGNAAVVSHGDGDDRALIAYLEGAGPELVRAVHSACRAELPTHAVPQDFVLLDKLPLGSTGKVDRHALPEPPRGRSLSAAPMRSASGPVEQELVRLWCQLLDRDEVSVADDFFEIGGHSMVAVQLVTTIEDTFGVRVDLPAFYERPTIADLAMMVGAPSAGPWLVRQRRRDGAAADPAPVRLVCFPFAGGGPSAFHGWVDLLPSGVEVLCVQPPGRGERRGEPPARDLARLVSEVGAALIGGGPDSGESAEAANPRRAAVTTVLFGHSWGAIVAFEVARWLRRNGCEQPGHLMVSAAAAPHVAGGGRVHLLPDDELWRHAGTLGGTPPELLADQRVRDVVLPTLRADFELDENYRYVAEEPLDCPITVFSGDDDTETTPDQLAQWRLQTTGSFDRRELSGGHFFLHSSRDALVEQIAGVLDGLRTEAVR